MITIKNAKEIDMMRDAGHIVRDVLLLMGETVKEGITTYELDEIARKFIEKQHATPSFLNYEGYPASICVSINEEVVHGIPSKKRIIKNGDIVSVDVGAVYKGWQGDAARTFCVGDVKPEYKQLVKVTEESFFKGIQVVKDGTRLGDLGFEIQSYAESFGYGVVRSLIGHGIGREMHESPDVPNYGTPGRGLRLKAGMTIAIEPMITFGSYEVVQDRNDGWTIRTFDGKPASHYENTIAITENGCEILTL